MTMLTIDMLRRLHPRMTERATILCSDGWAAILDIFLDQVAGIEKRMNHAGSFRLLFADEHLGGLTLLHDLGDADRDGSFALAVNDAATAAELRSLHFCEVCGAPGKLRCDEIGWLSTTCYKHAGDTVVAPGYEVTFRRRVGDRIYTYDPKTDAVTMRGDR